MDDGLEGGLGSRAKTAGDVRRNWPIGTSTYEERAWLSVETRIAELPGRMRRTGCCPRRSTWSPGMYVFFFFFFHDKLELHMGEGINKSQTTKQ